MDLPRDHLVVVRAPPPPTYEGEAKQGRRAWDIDFNEKTAVKLNRLTTRCPRARTLWLKLDRQQHEVVDTSSEESERMPFLCYTSQASAQEFLKKEVGLSLHRLASMPCAKHIVTLGLCMIEGDNTEHAVAAAAFESLEWLKISIMSAGLSWFGGHLPRVWDHVPKVCLNVHTYAHDFAQLDEDTKTSTVMNTWHPLAKLSMQYVMLSPDTTVSHEKLVLSFLAESMPANVGTADINVMFPVADIWKRNGRCSLTFLRPVDQYFLVIHLRSEVGKRFPNKNVEWRQVRSGAGEIGPAFRRFEVNVTSRT